MDDIQSAALAIEQLKNCVYEITLGRKGKLTRIILAFTEDDLHHLAGLHKLVDIEQIRSGKRSRIYESILSGTITGDFLKKSARYHEIEARIQALVYLEDMLDGDQLYFKYDPRKKAFSRIEADYLVSGKANNTPVYLFLGSRSDDTYYCRSFFPQERVDYAEVNEARFSNIFIEKRASSCPQSLEKSRLFSYPLLMSEGENSQNVKRIFLRKVVI